MGKVKNEVISNEEINELKNVSFRNKKDIMFKSIKLDVDGLSYQLRIRGVGKKTVKLELYIPYESIIDNKGKCQIEHQLWDKLTDNYMKAPVQRIGVQ